MSRYRDFFAKLLVMALSCHLGLSLTPEVAQAVMTNMGAEELFMMEIPTVISASKMNESVAHAPSAVTSFSAKDIRSFGYYTLADLANVTPGYSSYTIFGERVFETRGQKAGSFNNNKHLLFIDGIPVNHARAYKANTEEELPLLFAKNVEFLRGPASALYGVSAFYGVVSVNSQDLETNGTQFEQKASLGNMDDNRRFMTNYIHKRPTKAIPS
jgi:outer membrane receptor for ferrienterochelin and colicins